MKKIAGGILSGLIAILLSLGIAAPSKANEAHPAFASIGSQTSIPIGHIEFCQRRPSECQSTDMVRSIALDEALWRDLLEVNYHYNIAIKPSATRILMVSKNSGPTPSTGTAIARTMP